MPLGVYLCSDDDDTKNQMKMDVAQILVRTKYNLNLSEVFNIVINNDIFRVKVVKDSQDFTDSSSGEEGDS